MNMREKIAQIERECEEYRVLCSEILAEDEWGTV